MAALLRLPLFVLIAALTGLSMLLPAAYASVNNNDEMARTFLYSGLLVLVVAGLIGLATAANPPRARSRDALLTMLTVYAGMPLVMALPFAESMPDTGLFNAWWEMTSALTTTGASLYSADLLPMPLHLWRAMAGWMGGFFILAAATAIPGSAFARAFFLRTREPSRSASSNAAAMPNAKRMEMPRKRRFPKDQPAHRSAQTVFTYHCQTMPRSNRPAKRGCRHSARPKPTAATQ